ncbi:hypothetical protein [Bradyrhizobium japonicum]|uniref:hypothetical protein n=1 Tax=Bradyrhizobium japonicum TaxID=375 RepID=UPI0027151F07|nr:hypothetical protein [Bradyrhizobium japonicum]WLB58846.1 hypothetical protein QIH94_23640 [Bradyrhizobium japonicum]WLB59354.1 hypothetical protein QIH96_22690 [Bradyrhizobium japonicum]
MQIDSMTIDQLAELRDQVNALLAEGGAERQRELTGEAQRNGALYLCSTGCSSLGIDPIPKPV